MTGSEPLSIDEEYAMQQSWRNDQDNSQDIEQAHLHDTSRMIGDVNFYLNNTEDPHEAELEVMIAEPQYTGKGIATEALHLMMHYAVNDVGVTNFVVRIKETNNASIHLFQTKLGFAETERAPVFKEVTFRNRACF
ncbi:N-acetyltransferase 9 [Coemansia sp. RSA 2336]|nr:N-acetyltransferase 9 [Coemansia sp. RSA 2336]